MLLMLLAVIVTGVSGACEHDGNGVYVTGLDRYFDCKYLARYLTEDTYIGIYRNREVYCNNPTTQCCRTCASVLLKLANTDMCTDGSLPDGDGVYLQGASTFGCEYLREEQPGDEKLGIFQNKVDYCKMSTTDCCATCHDILSCKDAQTNGIYLGEMHYDCKYLRQYYPEDKFIGIYKNRRYICSLGSTDCCESCKQANNEDGDSHTSNTSTSPQPTTSAAQTSTGSSVTQGLRDECEDRCLWVADSSYGKCEWLLDPTRTVYSQRLYFCNNGFAPGCKRTCSDIFKENTSKEATTESTHERTTTASTFIMTSETPSPTTDITSTSDTNSETETTTEAANVQLSKLYDILRTTSEELSRQDEERNRTMTIVFAIFKKLGVLQNP